MTPTFQRYDERRRTLVQAAGWAEDAQEWAVVHALQDEIFDLDEAYYGLHADA